MDYKLSEAGRFRANPNASQYNTFTMASEDAPGTPQTDTLTIDTVAFTGGEVISGISYTGQSGAAAVYTFSNQMRPDAQRVQFTIMLPTLSTAFDPLKLRDAINEIFQREEHNPITKVEYDDVADEIVITHVGSGTLNKLIVDGAPVGTAARVAISGMSVEVQPAQDGEKEQTVDDVVEAFDNDAQKLKDYAEIEGIDLPANLKDPRKIAKRILAAQQEAE